MFVNVLYLTVKYVQVSTKKGGILGVHLDTLSYLRPTFSLVISVKTGTFRHAFRLEVNQGLPIQRDRKYCYTVLILLIIRIIL